VTCEPAAHNGRGYSSFGRRGADRRLRAGRQHTAIDIAAAAAERTPLYYQDPSGKPDYSPAPKKDAQGRDYVPVYEEPGVAPASPPTPASAPAGERKILYYRNPMGLPDTSPVPKKDSMSMDYIPVYADEGTGTVPGTVAISPERHPRPSCGARRGRFVRDSPLEERGFEPPVPPGE
jgi:hypothetical protein